MGDRLRVGVVFGGRSGEHDVSLASAASVMRELDPDKYEVIPIGITRDGKWLVAGDPLRLLREAATAEYAALRAGTAAPPPQTEDMSLTTVNNGLVSLVQYPGTTIPTLDVVFPVLHGPYGEDGTIQGLLDLANIPYVGAGVMASAVGMDKAIQKAVFRQHGLPVVEYLVIKRRDWERDPDAVVHRAEQAIGYPCFVKPVNLGSSVGISKAKNREGLRQALDNAAAYDRKLLVERAVPEAREIECSVLGNDDPITSVCGEVIPKREFYDYVAKYADENTELIVPADIPSQVCNAIRDMARRAFLAVDCAGMARVDFLATRDLSSIYLNEINTIPGFTNVSMYARMFNATGISYPELLDRLIALALERHGDKSRTKTTWM